MRAGRGGGTAIAAIMGRTSSREAWRVWRDQGLGG
jgi:hypothetical protein